MADTDPNVINHGQLDLTLRLPTQQLALVVADLGLTDPDDILWLDILMANLAKASLLGGNGAIAIHIADWQSLDMTNPEDVREVRIYRLLEEHGYIRRRNLKKLPEQL